MKPSEETSSIDRQLDKLLAAQPVSASVGFEAAVMERLKDRDIDKSLDALLRDQPVEASPGFTEKTMKVILEQNQKPRSNNLVVFPQIFWWAGAAAAMLVAGFFATQAILDPTAVDPVVVKNTESEIPIDVEENTLAVLANMEALFVLADGLSDAELFLDDEAYATLDTLSYEEAVLF